MSKDDSTPIAFRVDKDLAERYKVAVRESGYKHTHLISIAMERVIIELEDKKTTQL
jgi:tRNA(Phe) wybutosine-synthesizing methylase Tyw3